MLELTDIRDAISDNLTDNALEELSNTENRHYDRLASLSDRVATLQEKFHVALSQPQVQDNEDAERRGHFDGWSSLAALAMDGDLFSPDIFDVSRLDDLTSSLVSEIVSKLEHIIMLSVMMYGTGEDDRESGERTVP